MTEFEKKLQRLAEEAKAELKAIGINPSINITQIKENRKATKRLGCCKKEKNLLKESFIIEISTVVKDEPEEMIKEILIHELLHTCKGCFDHQKQWKLYAYHVNQAYGYHISTCTDTGRMKTIPHKEKRYHYEIVCQSCGNRSLRQIKSKVVQHPELYRCSKCKGLLEVREI